MKQKQSSILVKEIGNLLSKYLGNREANEFSIELENMNPTPKSDFIRQSNKDTVQINYNISYGSERREFIQAIISFAEVRISEEYLLKLMLEMCHLMIFNGELSFASELAEDMISKIEGNKNYYSLEGDAYLALAKISWSQAYWEESIKYVKNGYEIFRTHHDLHGYAKCENLLGSIFGEQGDVIEAHEHFNKGLKYLTDIDDVSLRSMFEINLGILFNIQGEYAKAMWNFKNALNKCILLKDTRRVARIRHNLGMLYTKVKDYQAAIEEFDKSISISLEYEYLSNCAIGYIGKAYIYTKLNNTGLAEAFTDKALEIAYKINDALSIADVYRIKGMIQSNLMNYDLSEELFENSIRLSEDFENKINIAETKLELSDLYNKTKRSDEAEDLRTQVLGYYNLIKAKAYVDSLLNAHSN
jgi:tetratricopeptide (TPR) repeat protein